MVIKYEQFVKTETYRPEYARCRNCRHRDKVLDKSVDGKKYCKLFQKYMESDQYCWDFVLDEDYYCSEGEQKETEDASN